MKCDRRLCLPLLACLLALCLAAPAAAQQHTFGYRVTINGATSDWHTFGLRLDALAGLDAYDLPQPPPPPGFPFTTYFVMLDPPAGLPNHWLGEFRPTAQGAIGNVELWQLAIESPDTGANCRLEVQDLAPVSSAYDLYLLGESGAEAMFLPAVLDFPVTGPSMTRYLELHYGTPVPVEHDTWGNVKALYRR